MKEQIAQKLISTLIPGIVGYLRSEIVPLISSAETPLQVSAFDMNRIKHLIGESIWQGGLPVVANKPSLSKLGSYQNPFSKALSSLTATESTTG